MSLWPGTNVLRQPELQKIAVLRSSPYCKMAGRKIEKIIIKLRIPMAVSRSRGKPHSQRPKKGSPLQLGACSSKGRADIPNSQGIPEHPRKAMSKQKTTAVKSMIKKKKKGKVLTTVTKPIGRDKNGDTRKFKILKMPKYYLREEVNTKKTTSECHSQGPYHPHWSPWRQAVVSLKQLATCAWTTSPHSSLYIEHSDFVITSTKTDFDGRKRNEPTEQCKEDLKTVDSQLLPKIRALPSSRTACILHCLKNEAYPHKLVVLNHLQSS
ncbi:hypothetical protein HPG69_019263, partial [Diceros bicornis minor]